MNTSLTSNIQEGRRTELVTYGTYNFFDAYSYETRYNKTKIPGSVVPSRPKKTKDIIGKVTNFTSGYIVSGKPGGGGDIRGTNNVTMRLFVPELLGKYVYGRPVTVVAVVQYTFGKNPQMPTVPTYSIQFDTSKVLDSAVILSTKTIISNSYAKALMFRVWGIMRPYVPSYYFGISCNFDWITNNHGSDYTEFQATLSLELSIEGTDTRLRVAPTELDFEVLEVSD